jgi:hypothetical protein
VSGTLSLHAARGNFAEFAICGSNHSGSGVIVTRTKVPEELGEISGVVLQLRCSCRQIISTNISGDAKRKLIPFLENTRNS